MSIAVEQETQKQTGNSQLTATKYSWHHYDKEMTSVCPVKDPFQEALLYKTYHLAGRSSHNDNEVGRSDIEWAKRVQEQLKWHLFNSFIRIHVPSSLIPLNWRVIQNGVQQGTVLWLIYFYEPLCFYFRDTYAMDDITAETDAHMMQLAQPSNKTTTEYAEKLWNETFRCSRKFDEYVLKRIFNERMSELNPQISCLYQSSKKKVTVHDPARPATSLTKLQHGSSKTDDLVTTTKRIYDVKIVDTKVGMLSMLIWTRCHRMKLLSGTGRPLDPYCRQCF